MNKQNVLYLYNGVVFTCRREWSTNTGYNMNEPQKHYAEWKKLYAKGQISRSSSWKICKDTEYFGGCQGKGRIGKDFQVWGLFLDDENILELDSGDSCTACKNAKNPLNYTLSNGSNGKFYIMWILSQFLKIEWDHFLPLLKISKGSHFSEEKPKYWKWF